jgi:hypothetical protein
VYPKTTQAEPQYQKSVLWWSADPFRRVYGPFPETTTTTTTTTTSTSTTKNNHAYCPTIENINDGEGYSSSNVLIKTKVET